MHLLYLNYDALIRSLCDDYDYDDDDVRAQCNTVSRKSIKRSSPIILLRRVLLSIKSRYAFYLQWSVLYLCWYFFLTLKINYSLYYRIEVRLILHSNDIYENCTCKLQWKTHINIRTKLIYSIIWSSLSRNSRTNTRSREKQSYICTVLLEFQDSLLK